MTDPVQNFFFENFFLDMHCEKWKGGKRSLVLKGNHLIKAIGRRVTDEDLMKIIWFLRVKHDIVSLEMPYNLITGCGLITLTDFLVDAPNIVHLNLIGNNITHRGIGYLVRMSERLRLHTLRLTGNKLGNEGGRMLSTLLYNNTTLRSLDMSDTHQTLSGLAHILTALMPSRGGTRTLESIDIGRPLPQPFHHIDDSHMACFLGQVFSDNKSLKEIHLQQYHLDFRDIELMLPGLFDNRTLVCLDLNNNNIGDDGVGYLCRYLEKSPPLESLMIAANDFGNQGALSLSRSLPYSNVRVLDVSNNHITDKGMMSIFYTIRRPDWMKSLFFWGNKLTHESLVVLKRLFETNLLDPEHTDVQLYGTDDDLHASWNYQAKNYAQKFYCITDSTKTYKKMFAFKSRPPIPTS